VYQKVLKTTVGVLDPKMGQKEAIFEKFNLY